MDKENIKDPFCYDCKKGIEIKDKEIINGVLASYEKNSEKLNIFKCNNCFSQSKALKNFQTCEIYSRVVGYYRPVQGWNKGKQQEYDERKEYKE